MTDRLERIKEYMRGKDTAWLDADDLCWLFNEIVRLRERLGEMEGG